MCFCRLQQHRLQDGSALGFAASKVYAFTGLKICGYVLYFEWALQGVRPETLLNMRDTKPFIIKAGVVRLETFRKKNLAGLDWLY